MKKVLEQITREAQVALGINLVSLILYGSHARNEATASSNINLFLLVRDGTAKDLSVLNKYVPGWIKLGALPPVIVEKAQFPRSFDTFAIEYVEMAASRKILAGEDPFADFQPNWPEVRDELERESRQKFIGLTQQWLMCDGNPETERRIISSTLPGYMALLRGAIYLDKKTVEPHTYHSILAETATMNGLDSKVWRKLWQVARENEKLKPEEMRELMQNYLDQARALVCHLDQNCLEG